jgi:Tfp pilus assembly protein PilX
MSARFRGSHVSSRQDGIVLFIALIVMVAMSLAGVALVRSIETTTAVVGNLAFRQAAMLPANMAVEAATAALFANASTTNAATVTDKEADLPAEMSCRRSSRPAGSRTSRAGTFLSPPFPFTA